MYLKGINVENNEYEILQKLLKKNNPYLSLVSLVEEASCIILEGGKSRCIYRAIEFLGFFKSVPDMTTLTVNNTFMNSFPSLIKVDEEKEKSISIKGRGFDIKYTFERIEDDKYKIHREVMVDEGSLRYIVDHNEIEDFMNSVLPISNVQKSLHHRATKKELYTLMVECIDACDDLDIGNRIENEFKEKFRSEKMLAFLIRAFKNPDRYFGYMTKRSRDIVPRYIIPCRILSIIQKLIEYGCYEHYTNVFACCVIDMLKWYKANIPELYLKNFVESLAGMIIYHIDIGLMGRENFTYLLDTGIEYGIWKAKDRETILKEFDEAVKNKNL